MDEHKNENFDQSKLQLELEKTRLEVEQLKIKNRWDRGFGKFANVIPIYIAVGAFLFGLYQFNAEQARSNEAKEKEFKKHFWEKQLDTYSELCNLASRLSTATDSISTIAAYKRYDELYHGDMVIFQDTNVMRSSKNFLLIYLDFRRSPSLQRVLQDSARSLAFSCRTSILKTWDINLGQLDLKRY